MKSVKIAASLLRAARRISFIIHKNPDGDAVGSAVALMGVLEASSQLICQHPISPVLESIIGSVRTENELPVATDLFVILDCADIQRTGFARELFGAHQRGKKILVIDHHQRGNLEKIATYYVGDINASSTCEIVSEIINELRVKVSPKVATSLLLGLVTDTSAFQHPNTTSRTLNLAAGLIRQGADFDKVRSVLNRSQTIETMRIWGKVLSGVIVNSMGLAIARVRKHMLQDSKSTERDVAGIAKYLCSLEGTKAALVLMETKNGWRGVLRASNKELNVGRLAKILGGNGSKKVAGFLATDEVILGTIKDA